MFHGEEFWLARFLFQRRLALLFLLAFLVAAFQFRPLAGEDGMFPLEWYAEVGSVRERPSSSVSCPEPVVTPLYLEDLRILPGL